MGYDTLIYLNYCKSIYLGGKSDIIKENKSVRKFKRLKKPLKCVSEIAILIRSKTLGSNIVSTRSFNVLTEDIRLSMTHKLDAVCYRM